MEYHDVRTCLLTLSALVALGGCISGGVETTTTTATFKATSTSTSSTATTTTTETTTTSAAPASTSTTLFRVGCSVNLDCGVVTEERICYMGGVYVNRITPVCQSPDTPYAKCVNMTKLSQSPAERCPGRCESGRCVS